LVGAIANLLLFTIFYSLFRFITNPNKMKQITGISVLIFSLFFQSCITKRIAENNLTATEQESVRNESSNCFVEFADGQIKNFSTLKLIKGITTTPHLLGDGKFKIKARDIRAYQNNNHYAISQKVYNPKRLSYVAIESLPGFAVQIAKGKLNIYVRKSYDSNKAIEEYFIQKGDDPISEYSYEAMIEVIKDNPEAADFFNSQKYKAARPILKGTADLFNSGNSFTSK